MNLDSPPHDLEEIQEWISKKEEATPSLKPQAKASIVWTNPQDKVKTPFSIFYLHGFKASPAEGSPTHKHIAQKLGCNLYLHRLKQHGLTDANAFKNLCCKNLTSSAEEAFKVAQELGEKVIIMGTSTGASLSLYLAAQTQFKNTIAALLLYSPLIKFYGFQNLLLANRWGRNMLKWVVGEDYRLTSQNQTKEQENIWYSSYHINGAFALGTFVEKYMRNDLFKKVTCPVFTAYYYKNLWDQDKVVSVRATKKMYNQLGTPTNKKNLMRLPNAGSHVISSGLVSKSIHELESASIHFLRKQLALNTL